MGKIIARHAIPPGSAIGEGFSRIDYADSYGVPVLSDRPVEEIAVDLFDSPGWIKGLMKFRDALVGPLGLKTTQGQPQSKQNLFPVIGRSENELVMGERDAHLDFRVSVLTDPPEGYVWVTTAVHYNNRWGRIYFLLIKPFHRLIVRSLIKKLHNL